VSIRLEDELLFSPTDDSRIALKIISRSAFSPPLPVDENNLIIRAARLLQAESGTSAGAKITLWKRIPSEAGLGGGSSDAAATLIALNRFWQLNLSPERLHALAARLGSDVNFFLDSVSAALCTGRGETIAPLPLPFRLHLVLIKPRTGLSTGRVFQAWRQQHNDASSASPNGVPAQQAAQQQDASSGNGSVAAWTARKLGNELEVPAAMLNTEIHQVLERLHRLDVIGSGMTGSGSACFAVCRTARQATVVAGRCRHWNMGQVFVVSSGV